MKKTETRKCLLEGLTEDQQKCVESIDKNLEIVACAGAGKTKTITHRILNLIDHGVNPENIVAITFTKKAAAELKGRIYKLGEGKLGSTIGFSKMYIGTIDSFCLKMLQDYKDEYAKFSVLDDVQVNVFLERFEKKNETGFKDSKVDKAWNLNHSGKDYVEKYSKKLGYYAALMSLLNNCWHDKTYRARWDKDTLQNLKAYNACLRKNKYFDFSGLIREMIENLDPDSDTNRGKMPKFAKTVYEKVKYLIIDEYQDTNPAQEYLTELFYKYGKANICVVGDADQTIYQFRGSDESNILEFKKRFKAEKRELYENFRSTPAVIDIAATSIDETHAGDPDYKRMARAKKIKTDLEYEDGDTVYAEFDDYDKEVDFIAERVAKLKKLGIPYKEMAVLLRKRGKNNYGNIVEDFQQKLAARFKRDDIPYVIEGMNLLFTTKEYDASLGIFQYLYEKIARAYNVNASSKESSFPAMNVTTKVVKDGEVIEEKKPEKKEPKFVNGYMNNPKFTKKEKEEKELNQKTRLKNLWLAVGDFIPEDRIDAAIKQLASIDWNEKERKYGYGCNMQEIYLDFISTLDIVGIENPDQNVERVLYNLGKFSKLIADFELLFYKDFPSYKLMRFKRHMDEVADGMYPEGLDGNQFLQADGVRIMTIHQSKGLEFTAVFVPTLAQSIFPGVPFTKKKGYVYSPTDLVKADWVPNYTSFIGGVEAERKVFYVAVSRAKKFLFLTRSQKYGGIKEDESEFLKTVKKSSYLKKFDGSVKYGKKHLPEIEDTVLPIVLNFSILSNYFDCPYRFKISNMFGFVQPYARQQGYGKMLHEIMMHIHRAWEAGETLTEEQIDKIAEDALYLPFAISDELENALVHAKNCANAYVEQNKDDANKIIASEMDIDIEMGSGVSVNGRIDLVRKMDDETGKEMTAIVDLKSAGKDAEQCLNAEQLKIYAIGYEEATGEPADYLMIYNLDTPDGSNNKGESVNKKALDKTRKMVVDAAKCIRDSNLPKKKGKQCDKCYVKGLCKDGPCS